MSKASKRKQNRELALQKAAQDARPQGAAPNGPQTPPERALTLDAFQNAMARLGWGMPNFIEATQYPLTRLTRDYQTLNSLYRSHWIIRRIIDTIPEDMVKAGWRVSSQLAPDMIDRIDRATERTQLPARLSEGLRWGRLYGGAGAIMLIAGHETILDQPLRLEDVMPGSFKGLMVVDRWSGVFPGPELVTDIDDPQFGYPDYYQVTDNTTHEILQRVHHSRVLRFIGRDLPFWERQAETYWGASEIEHVYNDLRNRDNTSANMAMLVFTANLRVLKMADFGQLLATGNQQAAARVLQTIQAQNQLANSFSTYVLNKDDDFDTRQYSFGGLADVYEKFMFDLCGAAEIPFTKLFGRSPAGLDATGEGDLQNYYDMIASRQGSELRPVLNQVLPILMVSELGALPNDFGFEFNPVRSVSDKERAELGKTVTEAVINGYNAGLASEKLALMELRQQKDVTGLWSNITDEMIDAASDQVQTPGEMLPELGILGEPTVPGLEGQKPKPLVAGDRRLANDDAAHSDDFIVKRIEDLHKKLGYSSENPPEMSAHAEADWGEVWAQLWSTGMDWNWYLYMVDSEHDAPRLIAYQDTDSKGREKGIVVAEGGPSEWRGRKDSLSRPEVQDFVDKWVLARAKKKELQHTRR